MKKVIKHPQHILALANTPPTSPFCGLVTLDYQDWLQHVNSDTILMQREALESIPEFRQVLPYVIIKQKAADGTYKYSTYYRTKLVGEQKLAHGISLGYGGHIDLEDIVSTHSVIDLGATIAEAVRREVVEEVKIMVDGENISLTVPIKPLNKFIYSEEQKVDRFHVGVLMEVEVPENAVVTTREDELEIRAFLTAKELMKNDEMAVGVKDGPMLESWSRLYIKDVYEAEQGFLVAIPYVVTKAAGQFFIESDAFQKSIACHSDLASAIQASERLVLNGIIDASKIIHAGNSLMATSAMAEEYENTSATGIHWFSSRMLEKLSSFTTIRTFDDGYSGYVFYKEPGTTEVKSFGNPPSVCVNYSEEVIDGLFKFTCGMVVMNGDKKDPGILVVSTNESRDIAFNSFHRLVVEAIKDAVQHEQTSVFTCDQNLPYLYFEYSDLVSDTGASLIIEEEPGVIKVL